MIGKNLIRLYSSRCGTVKCKNHSISTFNYLDALDIDSQLTEDERSLRDQARKYCQDKLLPRVTNAFRNEKFDPTLLPEIGSMGFLGAPYKVKAF
jgi:glutaryl-CoA dehydrogenase